MENENNKVDQQNDLNAVITKEVENTVLKEIEGENDNQQNNQKAVNEKNEKDVENQRRIETVVKATEGMTTAVFMFSAIGSSAQTIAPILAVTGIGAPVAVALYLVAKGFELKVKRDELMYVVRHTINILTQCYLLHGSICTHLLYFLNNTKVCTQIFLNDQTKNLSIDPQLIDNIKNTLYKIKYLVEKVMPQEGQGVKTMDKLSRFYNRNFSPNFYKNQLLKELTLLNGYFIMYETKFTRIVQVYEYYIKNVFKCETELTKIYGKLYEDDNYMKYIKIENNEGFEAIKEKLNNQINQNKGIVENFKKTAETYIRRNPDIISDNSEGTNGGGKRTKRRKPTKTIRKVRRSRRKCKRSQKK